jgi:hypothetical protein
MANMEHLEVLSNGIVAWNQWREKNVQIAPDLSEAHLSGFFRDRSKVFMKGERTNFSGINLTDVNLQDANLEFVDLIGAKMVGANLLRANLRRANLTKADLGNADLYEADLYKSNLSGANLSNVRLVRARLVGVNFEDAILENCNIYGISAWDLKLNERTKQSNLVISDPSEDLKSPVRIENIEIGQFVHLLLNKKIRDLLNTIGQKGVLILGRFSPPERKAVLDAIRDKLHQLGYVPIVFDFERPTDRDFTETIMTLAGMCRFIIADITNPKSSPLELQATVPNYMIPFVPIIQKGEDPFAMFENLQTKHDWVLDLLIYDSVSNLIEWFEKEVVEPALEKHTQLVAKKAGGLRKRHLGDPIVKPL